ncbi:MAG: PQQ-dependent sugar dehydrogenase [Candidatus Eisenbacteria bacterium]
MITRACLILLGVVLAPATGNATETFEPAEGLKLVQLVEGLDHPVFATSGAGDARIFILEQPGRIRVLKDGVLLREPFLDITDRVGFGGERGLLGLAFHPDHPRNGRFYVNYTDRNGDTQVVRYHVGRHGDRADPASASPVLSVKQPFSNHNGGMIAFGPDRMLYVGMGDGGSAADPFGNGQKRSTLLGKMLRLDVDRATPYAIPPDNPFRGRRDARPEIWATGLRNPWRFSFDHTNRLLVIGDVGQNRYEEIDLVRADRAGLDYGWNVREGLHVFALPRPSPKNQVEPVLEYPHDEGCSVTGGYVYRGSVLRGLDGTYFFSDYCQGWLRSFRVRQGRAVERRQWSLGTMGQVTSFGEDSAGELLVCTTDGRLWRIVPTAR